MIRVFLIRAPRIIGDDCVDFEQAKKEDQSSAVLQPLNTIHLVIAVVQIIGFLQPERAGDLQIIPIIGNDTLSTDTWTGSIVNRGPNEIAGIALTNQLRYKSAREDRDIVDMWLN